MNELGYISRLSTVHNCKTQCAEKCTINSPDYEKKESTLMLYYSEL